MGGCLVGWSCRLDFKSTSLITENHLDIVDSIKHLLLLVQFKGSLIEPIFIGIPVLTVLAFF